mgnify:CR=1 FL=1
MTPAGGFLVSLGQALSTMGLYGPQHPARQRAGDGAFDALTAMQAEDRLPHFSFVDGEIIYQRRVLREIGEWDWARKLERVGIQRIEVGGAVDREAFDGFLARLGAQLASGATAVDEAAATGAIRFGALALRDEEEDAATGALALATISYSLRDEVRGIEWVHARVLETGELPLLESETLVRSLALAMRSQGGIRLPLLRPPSPEDYVTTHASNVAILAMGLAEHLGLADREVRAIGLAGLLHDLGMLMVPPEAFRSTGPLTDAARAAVERHPVEGARLLLGRQRHLELAAVVAYEHHLQPDGGGYPALRYPRRSHFVSRLIQVCDVYDALITDRPYRPGRTGAQALARLDEIAGTGVDASIVHALRQLLEVATLEIDDEPQG